MDRCAYHPKSASHRLEKIQEEAPVKLLPVSVPAPETPVEPMDFLSRSWSLSAVELSRALSDVFLQSHSIGSPPSSSLDTKISDASSNTSSIAASEQELFQPFAASAGGTFGGSPPVSPRQMEDVKECVLLHQALVANFISKQQLFLGKGLYKSVLKGRRAGRWLQDQKERKKEETRTHNAQLHAATSVAGVAAAVAAIAAATAMSSEMSADQRNTQPKTSAAVASAAALVASHCVEIAEEMGADHDQILAVVNSAINVKTTGDIMTLTAGAATALRGAAALKARLQKGMRAATVLAPTEEEIGNQSDVCSALNFVSEGRDLLKLTRKGLLHWKQVSFYINSNWTVVVKMKSKHMVGTFVKKKKSVVSDVCGEVMAWSGRGKEEGRETKAFFAIRTTDRLIEFECRNESDKQIWMEGIRHMLHCCANTSRSLSL